METMDSLDLHVQIYKRPNEIAEAIPFDEDETHRAYDREYANRFWRVLVQADRVLKAFRAGYLGKSSPVHLFWGGLDLAVARFSGRPAPAHPGGIPNLPDWVTREAYYSTDLGEFLLPYDVVRESAAPDDTLRALLQSTYEAAADLGKWDRGAL